MKTSALLLGKAIVGTTTQTLTWPSELFPVNQYDTMDVVINIGTITSSGATFSIQERFSDLGFVETITSGTLTATGTTYLVHDNSTVGTPSYIKGQSAMLGKGGEKQCVITQTGTVTGTFSASVYLIPYNL